ncbi:MAG: glycosyltransferase family 4 protein [Gemmatimonadaceae bacterium]|nr:glycosyltransferase family 4 protein [Gemmatimonadaceae bacterium]
MRLYNAIDRVLLHLADEIVVVAGAHRRLFKKRNVRHIPNAVIQQKTAVAPRPRQRRDHHPVVAFFGRLSAEKGVSDFAKALSILSSRGESFSVLVAGDGPERSDLEHATRQLGIDANFVGHLPSVTELYHQVDVVVLPSLSEGMPNVLLEALASDTPVVATAVGDVAAILTDPEAGFLIEPGKPEEIATAIQSALRTGRTPTGSDARRCIAMRFSVAARVKSLLDLYGRREA